MTNHTVSCSAISREQQIPEFSDALVSSVSRSSYQKSIKSAPQSRLRLNFSSVESDWPQKVASCIPLGGRLSGLLDRFVRLVCDSINMNVWIIHMQALQELLRGSHPAAASLPRRSLSQCSFFIMQVLILIIPPLFARALCALLKSLCAAELAREGLLLLRNYDVSAVPCSVKINDFSTATREIII
jgi:hypothetical protein